MSSSGLRCRRSGQRSDAVGKFGKRAEGYSTSAEGEYTEVQICWKPVLQKLVAELGGSEPIYTTEEIEGAMFQVRVSFTIPSCDSIGRLDSVSVTGNRRFLMREAQSEAAATALQCFACGIYNTKVMDISLLRHDELKLKCENILINASELQLALDMVLAEWVDCTQQVENTYEVLFSKAIRRVDVESVGRVEKFRIKAGKRLHEISTANRKRYNEAVSKAKSARTDHRNARDFSRNYFNGHLIPRVERHHGELTREIKISMTTVLTEMMISLGWDEPKFKLSRRTGRVFTCAVELQPPDVGMGRISVECTDESTKEKAMENAAKAVILELEKLMSICLVDLNYNKRSEAEEHVIEAESILENISSLLQDVIAEWEEEVCELDICDEYCRNVMAKHVTSDPCNREYNAKWECAEAVAELFSSCATAFKHGRRHQNFFLYGWIKNDACMIISPKKGYQIIRIWSLSVSDVFTHI